MCGSLKNDDVIVAVGIRGGRACRGDGALSQRDWPQGVVPRDGGEEGGVGCWTGAVLCSTASARWTQVAPQPVSLSLPMRSYPIADIGHHVIMRGLCGLGVGGKGEEVGGQRQSLYPTATHCVQQT